MAHGNRDIEWLLQVEGAAVIREAGILLKLPQFVIATAQVLMHRCFSVSSVKETGLLKICMGATYLACKVEEEHRRIRHIVNVFDYLRRRHDGERDISPLVQFSDDYYAARKTIVDGEMCVLKSTGFRVTVEHPYALLMCYLQQLGLAGDSEFKQQAWTYLNDCYLSNVIIKYQPQVLACSVIQMTADTLNHNLRTNPPWFELLDTSLQDMTQVMDTMKRIYDLSPADFRQLPWTRRELQTYLRSK